MRGFRFTPLLLVSVAACSGSSSTGTNNTPTDSGSDGSMALPDAGNPVDTGTTTPDTSVVDTGGPTDTGTIPPLTDGAAPTTFPFPAVITSGGPLVTAPKVVTITFSGDTMTTDFQKYGATATNNAYWDATRAGLCIGSSCIGDGPAGVSVALTTAAAATYTDTQSASTLQDALSALITAGTVPAPDANTIYAMYFPASTTVTTDGGTSCNDFYGYHSSMKMGSTDVIYAVINECPADPMYLPPTTLASTTLTASHEIMEAASDGVLGQDASGNETGGYYLDFSQDSSVAWNDALGGEIGDLCVDEFGLGQDETTEGGYTVQRIWNPAAAAAGKNPCLPVPSGEVYFNAFPTNNVIQLEVGASTTIEVDALADGAMSPWRVRAEDWTDPTGKTTYATFSFVGGTVGEAGTSIQASSGDRLQLTVTLVKDGGKTANQEVDGAIVSSNGTSSATATAAHFWPFIILTSAEFEAGGFAVHKRHPRSDLSRRPGKSHPFGRLLQP